MSIKTAELLAALNAVKPGLANKEIVEQSTAFVFMGDKVATFNDELAVTHPIKTGLVGAVQAAELHKLLSRVKDDSLEIIVQEGEEGNQLFIKGKKMKAGIRLEVEVRLPLDSIPDAKGWKKVPANLKDGFRFVLFSASKDMTKPALTCVHINDGALETCDQFRLTRWTLNGPFGKAATMLPAGTVRQLLPFDLVEYAMVDGWVHFRTGAGTTLSCRTLDPAEFPFPDLDQFLVVDGDHVTMPQDLVSGVLERAGIFAERDFESDEIIKITLEEGQMTVKAEGKSGWLSESCRIKYKGDTRDVEINPKFLAEILIHLEDVVVSETAMLFSGADFKHAISLV